LLGVVACLCFSQIRSRGKGVDLGHNHIVVLSFPTSGIRARLFVVCLD